ncbi:LuxR C-terminal-related transcriptional regulator [Actinophytocola sp.]|jgi:DNA-binding CsgD family transcriptional regulator|uniref:LuxR C-terminal-related transcriptional regulator n=1 Tax=Actinophytocola sp. TaxID=1872138 RepID=UPI002ED78E0F
MGNESAIDDPYDMFGGDTEPRDGVFRTVFDRAGVRVAALDHNLLIADASSDFAGEFGRTVAGLRGVSFPALLHPSVRERLVQQLMRLVEGQRQRFVERVLAPLSGSAVFGGELTGFVVHSEANRVNGLLIVLRSEPMERGTVVVGKRKLLSEMDARILEGVAAGASTVQLAALLYLSCGGVEYHLTALLRAMKVGNRSALVSKAYSMGLFGVGTWPPRVLSDYVG